MKQKIIIVSHCFLNDASKLKNQNEKEQTEERNKKRAFLKWVLEHEIEIMQLPCPEFLLYGCNRWGHASSQFDTPFFRQEAKNMLEPYLLQWKEYAAHKERFELLGIIGINGSPSCGVQFTYDGDWGGEFADFSNVQKTILGLKKKEIPGIFMQVLQEMLKDADLEIPMYTLETLPEGWERK